MKLISLIESIIVENINKPVGCDKFNSRTPARALCKHLNSPKYRGLFQPVITSILDERKKRWMDVIPKEDQDLIFDVLGKLKSIDPNRKWQWPSSVVGKRYEMGTVDQFIKNRLPDLAFVYDMEHGTKWAPINKLDTNYSDSALFITDIIEKSQSFDSKQILDELLQNETETLKKVLSQIEKYKNTIYNDFLMDSEFYAQNSLYNSKIGEDVETLVVDTMQEDGWKLIHRGAGGDPIDVLLGIDLIMEKDGMIKTVQCKKVGNIVFMPKTRMQPELGAYKVVGKPLISKRRNLDYVGYGNLEGKAIICQKQKEVIKTDDGYQYTEKMVFPEPQFTKTYSGYGYFYVDADAVISKSKNL